MTFEEIQKTLERMLEVNKDIQIQQLKNQDAITKCLALRDRVAPAFADQVVPGFA